APPGAHVAVHAVLGDVQPPAREPAGRGDGEVPRGRIGDGRLPLERGVPGRGPLQPPRGLLPEGERVRRGALVDPGADVPGAGEGGVRGEGAGLDETRLGGGRAGGSRVGGGHAHLLSSFFSARPSRALVRLPSRASSTIVSRIRSTRPFCWESLSRKPRPIEEAISSAATRNSQAWASARRSPETTEGITAGSCTERNRDQPRSPKQRPASTRCGSICRSAAATVVNTGKKAPIAMSVILDSSPICSQRISSGTQASEGTARRAARVGFSSASPARDRPTTAADRKRV